MCGIQLSAALFEIFSFNDFLSGDQSTATTSTYARIHSLSTWTHANLSVPLGNVVKMHLNQYFTTQLFMHRSAPYVRLSGCVSPLLLLQSKRHSPVSNLILLYYRIFCARWQGAENGTQEKEGTETARKYFYVFFMAP